MLYGVSWSQCALTETSHIETKVAGKDGEPSSGQGTNNRHDLDNLPIPKTPNPQWKVTRRYVQKHTPSMMDLDLRIHRSRKNVII